MADNEVSAGLEIGVGGGLVPASAKFSLGLKRSWAGRGQEVIDSLLGTVQLDQLEQRLLECPEVEVLVERAVNAAAVSSVVRKRRLLARVVTAAVLDDAAIDRSTLIVDVLEQVDAVHLRCLEAIARAEWDSKEAGEWVATAPRSEKPFNQHVQDVADSYPSPVIKRLENLGLADASVSWDGYARVTGMTAFGELLLSDLKQEALCADD